MRAIIFLTAVFIFFSSCKKSMENDLPPYEAEISVEMYLEEGNRLKCLITEAIPYSSSTVNKVLANAQVIFSDGTVQDTLKPAELYDYETGRQYNYAAPKLFHADRSKTYQLKVTDSLGREVTASTRFSTEKVKLSEVTYFQSNETKNKFSIGFSFPDPAGIDNYYRVIIGEGVNNYEARNTDFLLTDNAFDGKNYSFTSAADYEPNDTIAVRLYTLAGDHYDYLQTAETARTANYNPFMQPVKVRSNIVGGQGIFTVILYDERKLVIL